jgi:phage protein U
MMSLGGFKFGLSTVQYQELTTNLAWRWQKKDRYNRAPALQYQGRDARTHTFKITVFPDKAADLTRFSQLEDLASKGRPVRLVSGGSVSVDGALMPSGTDLGRYAITSLSVGKSQFMADGVALQQTATLTITEYGEDV